MNSAFNNQILAEKLRKLNNSQQSIETLSHWCIFHRKKARSVVETWDKQIRELSIEQQVPLLYLANDILQNSRRRGGEFVTEFWRILPGTLKDVLAKGDERVRTVIFRLVDIWDERKVFGSRSRTLREELLGDDPPADLPEHRVKPSQTIRIKVPIGGIQEKLTSAYRAVQDVASDEDATLGRCNAAVIRIEGLEKESKTSKTSWETQDFTTLAGELQEQQDILVHCVEQLEMSELARAALVSNLKEALREQESKLELIRTQLRTARAKAERSGNLRQRFLPSNNPVMGEVVKVDNGSLEQGNCTQGTTASQQAPVSAGDTVSWSGVSVLESKSSVPDDAKTSASIAAEMAAKLTASASSAQMLTSVLSSFVAEEAKTGNTPEKRQRVSENVDGSPAYSKHTVSPLPTQSSIGMLHIDSLQSHPQHASSNGQVQVPLPILSPQFVGQASNLHAPGFGYPPQPPLPPPIPIPRQMVVGMPMQPQNGNPGSFQGMQAGGYYGQFPMPAPHLPRQ